MEFFGILVVAVVIGIGYWAYTSSNESTPVVETKTTPKPKSTKISRAVLRKLTKTQLEDKGRLLGIEVDKRQLKEKIVNEVFKAQ